ncbi:MAG: hypothetical protein D6756_08045 [Cyanobacteria bacterium J083]|nr:MAG: hypothetical protein D6756_08045 [Cyanobacteria bacterium J083]
MFQAGQIIDTRYQLEKPLGKNLPGKQTWLAADKLNNNSKVVIKLLAFISNVNWNELKMFERESEILQTLNHKYIPNYRSYL